MNQHLRVHTNIPVVVDYLIDKVTTTVVTDRKRPPVDDPDIRAKFRDEVGAWPCLFRDFF
jgi:hypothetical protein